MHLGTRGWVQQQVGADRLAGLRRAGEALAQPTGLETGLPAFLEELRRSAACRGAELQLRLAPEAPWTRLTVGDDADDHRSAPLVAALLRLGTSVHLAPGRGAPEQLALLEQAGWRDCLATPVHLEGAVVGLLCLHDQEGWTGFSAARTTLIEAAAGMLGEGVHRGS